MRGTKPKGPDLGGARRGIVMLFVFSFVVNTLLLTQPLFMLQVYDRVLVSGSYDTLVYISILAALALLLLGLTDAVRNIIASRLAARFEVANGARALAASIEGPKAGLGDIQPLRDLQAVKNFMGSRAIFAYFDLPFSPLFIGLLYFIHPDLFWLTVAGAAVLTGLALLNQRATGEAASAASRHGIGANTAAQAFARNAESLRAMGMAENVTRAWGREEAEALNAHDRISRRNAIFSGISRTIRIGLQIVTYAYGGYLVLSGEMTAGMIFAASLIAGRGLQPIDQVIGGWKGVVDVTRAWSRLTRALAESDTGRASYTELPEPQGRLDVEGLFVFAPAAQPGSEPLLRKVSARLDAGQCLAVIGPSGAGKSTFARTLIGALAARSGTVRLDGADIANWDPSRLGRHVGYLSQDVDLLPGTVAENIGRFDEAAKDVDIVAAARKAQVHDLIQKLPQGYDTRIGPGATQLSGGQRQRLGLARAFYGSPKLLVLDEPNANLDAEGDLALDRAVARARQDKVTVVIVTQRRPIAERADRILVLRDGAVEDFGSRQEVFARQAEKVRAAQEKARARTPARLPSERKVVAGRFTPVADKAAGAAFKNPA